MSPLFSIPWYAYPIILIFIFDFVAFQRLFLPYMRTFIRLRETAVDGCPLPDDLEPGKKIKLRKSMICRDPEIQAIWLRPRGLRQFNIHYLAATLKMDSNGRSIASSEIRLSLIFPFSMAVCLLAVYVISATSANTNAPSSALFVGIYGLLTLIVSFVGVRILRSRMEILVQDALSELKEMSDRTSRDAAG